MIEEHSQNEVESKSESTNEITEKDQEFLIRFNLKPEDLQHKKLAHEENV